MALQERASLGMPFIIYGGSGNNNNERNADSYFLV